ncbi:MAG: 2-amino-4-hydroxy-6-hydroxymethyldihydropteridine diphosphokinase [Methylococcales bacterium]
MTKVVAYLGLGSNLQTPILQLQSARNAIQEMDAIEEISFSSLYRSPPMGPEDQPDYVNAVMGIYTTLEALSLLSAMQQIENEQGRVRSQRWGARTLDIDILLYGDQQIHLVELTVPHIGIKERAFVLYPLFEIAPNLVIDNQKLIDMVNTCPLNGLELIA